MDEFLTLLTELLGADHDLVVALRTRVDGDRPWADTDGDVLVALDEGLRALADNDEASADVLILAADYAAEVRDEIAARDAEQAETEAARAEAVRRLRGETEQDDIESEPEPEPEQTQDAESEPEPEVEHDAEPVLAAAEPERRRVARRALPAARPTLPARTNERALVAAANVGGFVAGSSIRDSADLARAFQSVYDAGRGQRWGGPPTKVGVASVRLPELHEPDRFLDLNTGENMRKIAAQAGPEALVASGGVCGPLEARYDVVGISDDRRPIRDALPRFGASRGGIRYMPGLEIEDYAAANEVWTEATDASPGGNTKNVLTVACGTEVECIVDAVTHRMQFGNFMGRFSPEWVTATTREAMAAWARLAEDTLWNTMCTGSLAITIAEGLGAAPDLLTGLDRATAGMRSRYRMPPGLSITAIFPDYVLSILRSDFARRAPGDDTMSVSDAQIVSHLRAHGVEPVFSPDGGGQEFPIQGAGLLRGWPDAIEYLLFPTGTWLFLDGGELDLGVVRDSTLNGTNDYQTFFESFEQVCRVGVASASWCVTHDLCPDGSTGGPNTNYDPCNFGS